MLKKSLPFLSLLIIAFLSLFAFSALAGNPANSKKLINKPIEDFRYDEATRCSGKETKGAKEMANWLDHHIRGSFWGIYRCEKWGKNSASIHAEGRAIDWHLNAGNKKDKRAANKFIQLLLAKDKKGNHAALARRMGVQGLIFNCKAWWSGQSKMGKYSYCYDGNRRKKNLDKTQAHKDHIHIELNKRAANLKTSFWKYK